MFISNLNPSTYSAASFSIQDFLVSACDSLSQLTKKPYKSNYNKKRNNKQVVKIQNDYRSVNEFKVINLRRFKKRKIEYRLVLDVIIKHSTAFVGCDKSQKQLLQILAQSHPHIKWNLTKLKTIIRDLRDDKLIFIKYRFRDQSVYFPHDFFLDQKVKRKMRKYLPSLSEKINFIGKKSIPVNIKFVSDWKRIKRGGDNISTCRLGILNIPPLSLSRSVSQSTTRDTRMRARSIFTKQENFLEHFSPLLSGGVTDMLGLTLAGQAKLSIFSDEALNFALKNFATANKQALREPFRFFMSLCSQYYRQNNLTVDFAKFNRMVDQFKLTEKMPLWDKSRIRDTKKTVIETGLPKQTTFVCVNGCESVCNGWSLEHTQRAMSKKRGKEYVSSAALPVLCVLECVQPCWVDGKWTDEHDRKFARGLDFVAAMVPSNLKDEVLQKYKAQFGPKAANAGMQLSINHAHPTTSDWGRNYNPFL